MDARDLLASLTRRRVDAFFHVARQMPPERLEAKPGPNARTALDLIQETAVMPGFYADVVESRTMPEFTPEMMAQFRAAQAAIPDVDAAEAKCR